MRVVVIPKPKRGKDPLPVIIEATYVEVSKNPSNDNDEEYTLKCKAFDGSLFEFSISREIAYRLIGPNPAKLNSKQYYHEIFSVFTREKTGIALTSWGIIIDLTHNQVIEIPLKCKEV